MRLFDSPFHKFLNEEYKKKADEQFTKQLWDVCEFFVFGFIFGFIFCAFL